MNPTTDLAIVTSCHNYGQYLEDWAASILAQTIRPALVAIYEHGSTDASAAQADAAAAMLTEGGLKVLVEHHAAKLPFGIARNRAVALSLGCTWVMHLDADDMLMPHCLADVAAIADRCDVVALGYERCGDLAAGPKLRRKLYRSSSGPGVLVNSTPASGVSPYRRSFWERSPYPEQMTGGWDTALWIGFGHLGARILPTRRPCFWYRQHADSIFNTRRLASWPTQLVGNELQSRRRKDRGVSVLVPRSSDDGPERRRAWDYVRARYATFRPTWEIVEGISPALPWQKGEALRRALEQCHGKTAIVADADCLVSLSVLDEAVRLVESREAPWVVPHKFVHRLTAAESETWMKRPAAAEIRPPGVEALARKPYVGFPAGGILVVSRPMLQATGGIPAQFMGWGGEDEALAVIFDTLLGPHRRLDADLVHLWHPPQPDKRTGHRQNRAEFGRIRSLAGDPEALWRYLGDPRTLPRRAPPTIESGPAAWRRQAWRERASQLRAEMAATIDGPAATKAAAARQRGGGAPMKRDPRPIANKMLTGHLENKKPGKPAPLTYATATAQFLAERNSIGEDLLRRYAPPGASITVEMVRRAILAKRSLREAARAAAAPSPPVADDCGCGKKAPLIRPAVGPPALGEPGPPVIMPAEEPTLPAPRSRVVPDEPDPPALEGPAVPADERLEEDRYEEEPAT